MLPMNDRANGYDELAEVFGRGRVGSPVGAAQVRGWASSLGPGAEVLDVACGVGIAITGALIQTGCHVHAIDHRPGWSSSSQSSFRECPCSGRRSNR